MSEHRFLWTAGPLALLLALLGFSGTASRQPTTVVHVDPASIGGRCDDGRTVQEAGSPSTPWCSFARALQGVGGGETILLRPAAYGDLEIVGRRYPATVTVRPYPGDSVQIRELLVQESARVRVHGLTIRPGGGPSAILLSQEVSLTGSDLARQGLLVRASRDVTIQGNVFHDLERPPGPPAFEGYGIWANGFWAKGDSRNGLDRFVVRGNTFRNIPQDAMQIGGGPEVVSDVRIEGNTITDVHRDVEVDHPDGIQVLGAQGLTIRGNVIDDAEQCILVKDDTTYGLLLENNLLLGGERSGHCVQIFDAPGARIVNNTIWHRSDEWPSALLIRSTGEAPPKNTVLLNNVINRYGVEDEDWIARQDHNLIASGPRLGARDSAAAPRFADGWELAPGSPGIDDGTADGAPAHDRLGRPRVDDPQAPGRGPVDIGAHERQVAGAAPTGTPSPSARPVVLPAISVPRRQPALRRGRLAVRIRCSGCRLRVAARLRRGPAARPRTVQVDGRRRITLRLRRRPALARRRFVVLVRVRTTSGDVLRERARVRA